MDFDDFVKTETFKLLFKKFTVAWTEDEFYQVMQQYYNEVEYFLKLNKEDDGKWHMPSWKEQHID